MADLTAKLWLDAVKCAPIASTVPHWCFYVEISLDLKGGQLMSHANEQKSFHKVPRRIDSSVLITRIGRLSPPEPANDFDSVSSNLGYVFCLHHLWKQVANVRGRSTLALKLDASTFTYPQVIQLFV